jgi:serine/threonine-protein kinase
MLWEMLKGQRCLAGESEARTRENIGRFDIGQSSRRVSGLSPKLSEILRRNLDRDPGRRYSSAYQMLQRLAQSPEAQAAEASRAELAALVSEVTSLRHE